MDKRNLETRSLLADCSGGLDSSAKRIDFCEWRHYRLPEPGVDVAADSSKQVTELLMDWSRGDLKAREALMPMVCDELRRLAASYLRRERPDHTLQPTALVNEAYLRLVEGKSVNWNAVRFTPTKTGTRNATLQVNDNGGGSRQKASLSGTGN